MKSPRLFYIIPRKILFQSLMIEAIVGLPFISFIFALPLGIYGRPIYWSDESGTLWEKIGLLHAWLAVFSASALFCCIGFLISHYSRDTDRPRDAGGDSFVISMHFVGAIFGALVCLLFIGGFIDGNLFPNFADARFSDLFYTFSSAKEWGKLCVWAFIAGFSERLVPGLLDNLARKIAAENRDESDATRNRRPAPGSGEAHEPVE